LLTNNSRFCQVDNYLLSFSLIFLTQKSPILISASRSFSKYEMHPLNIH
jgi:hypothetical protein